MRLSGLLSREPFKEYCQVDGFLDQKLKCGKQRKIEVGRITLPFYCKICEDTLTFASVNENLICTGVNDRSVSIDTILKCPRCNAIVPVWFLIGSYRAYNDELGSGAIIYLRKVYEQIVTETAKVYGINMTTAKGYRRKFGDLLEEVNNEAAIVPIEFTKDKYTLFKSLSNVIHGEYNEEMALKQYPAFHRLVIGILDNINNNKELLEAVKELELNLEGEKNE